MTQIPSIKHLAACLIVLSLTGCALTSDKAQTTDSSSDGWLTHLPWVKKQDDVPEPYPTPVKIATTWAPDTLTQSGRTPTRGFGARVFFYDEK
ncbi:MAG: hypothetical protein AAF539_10445, partial [Planctomycetota bacterium]